MRKAEAPFDLIVWGATGFTGRLVAEYLRATYDGTALRWALGGRSRAKLEAVRRELDDPERSLVIADAHDRPSLDAMVEQARVVCTTVGPYARHGSELVAACAAAGTDYCDASGEAAWIRRMEDVHGDLTEASGARVLNGCGFCAVPSDIGTLLVQREAMRRHGAPSPSIETAVRGMAGGVSGGTVASALAELEDAADRQGRHAPQAAGSDASDASARAGVTGQLEPRWSPRFGSWMAPYPLAHVDRLVVRRSAARLPTLYGRDFRYREAMAMGSGAVGMAKAFGVAAALAIATGAMGIEPVRRLATPLLPRPGEGPSENRLRTGRWDMVVHGVAPDPAGKPIHVLVRGDGDPGYASASRMLGEAAVALARDVPDVPGGFHSPASAIGEVLLQRLPNNAAVGFAIE